MFQRYTSSKTFVSNVYNAVTPNAPFGCVNGAGLYDGERGEYVWMAKMPSSVIELVEYIDKNCTDLGIQVNTFDTVYFCRENLTMKNFRLTTGLENVVCDYNDVKEPIAKILFGCESEEEIGRIETLLKAHKRADEFDFIRSEKTLYEILPKGIGKGVSIVNLCRHLKIDVKNTIAIGDYNNDISMFRAAGLGIAVKNASRAALDAADMITVSNEEHAIARVISDLEGGKLRI